MTDDEWRRLVGEAVEARRAGRSVRHMAGLAGISEGLWRQIESGRRPLRHGDYETVNPKATTKAAVAVSLGWSEDSIDRLARGEEPVELLESVSQPTDDLHVAVEQLALSVESLLHDAAAHGATVDSLDARLAALVSELVALRESHRLDVDRLDARIALLESGQGQQLGD